VRNSPSVTLAGNLTSDVTLRSTAGGSVASFRMAVNDGWFDKKAGEWRNRTTYMQVSAWRQLGENVAQSLALGQPVVVVGKLRQHSYDKDGQTHYVVDVEAEAVGHDLSWGSAQFLRNPKGPQTAEVGSVPGTVVVEHVGVAA
jgi:single-strand DNA-binding protein